ncbi:MAG: FadR family transcriptional regulator [Lachnospiraceae bacterium]|nr:FadR family transcriptional regulator [Lachnospiraceae bacterium]
MMGKESLHSFHRVNLYEQIADYMEQLILDTDNKEWSVSAKLPAEQELADSFGVSRNVVREAMKLLKERGLVDSQNGVGAYVTKPDSQKLSTMIYRYVLMNNVDTRSIYDTRILLEVNAAENAARNASEEDLKNMRRLLKKMENRKISINERRETDFEIHIAVAQAAGNPLNVVLEYALKDVWRAMIEKGIFIQGGIEDACIRHERIMVALENHDAEAAGKAMREHLETSLQTVELYNQQDQLDADKKNEERKNAIGE